MKMFYRTEFFSRAYFSNCESICSKRNCSLIRIGTRSIRAGLLIVFSNNFNERYLNNETSFFSMRDNVDPYRSIKTVGRPLELSIFSLEIKYASMI